MKALLERSRYLLLIAVAGLLLASITLLVWGTYKTISVILEVVAGGGKSPAITISFIELMDTFLIAAVLYIFAVAIYELFIGDLELPGWLVVHNLDELKSRLIGVIVLVIVVTFAEHFIEWPDSQSLLQNGIGAAIIIGALAWFNRSGANHN